MSGVDDPFEAVNAWRAVARSPWRMRVRRVAVILSSSRAGSSLVKHVLSAHPEVASLDGEMEPYLALSGNGFGANSDSDALRVLDHRDALADNIFSDLSVASAELPPLPELKERWRRRFLLQFPLLFIGAEQQRQLNTALDLALQAFQRGGEGSDESALRRLILTAVFQHQPWRMNFYDAQPSSSLRDFGLGERGYFDEALKIEEPPFVLPRSFRRHFTVDDAASKTLLFKSPSDAYRIGIHEQLFPNAEIKYIHLSRGFAQTVNGLMDGWLSPVGFFAHDMARAGAMLAIRGYSGATPFGRRWWKFDLPPNWREFTGACLEEVCLNQWLATHQAILASGAPALRLAFEDFMAQPAAQLARIGEHLGLAHLPLPARLPVTMATDAPRTQRWRKRAPPMLALGQQPKVGAMMARLGYSMDPATWT